MFREFFEKQRKEKGRNTAFFVVAGLFLLVTFLFGIYVLFKDIIRAYDYWGFGGILLWILGFIIHGAILSWLFMWGSAKAKRK